MTESYLQTEGKVISSLGRLTPIWLGGAPATLGQYIGSTHLGISINNGVHEVHLYGGVFPFEVEDFLRLYFPQYVLLDINDSSKGKREASLAEVLSQKILKPSRIEKIVNGNVSFVFEDYYYDRPRI